MTNPSRLFVGTRLIAYVTDAQLTGKKSQERVLCFEASSGKPLWDIAYDPSYPDWAFTLDNEGRPTATPIIMGGKVYTLGIAGHARPLELS